MAAVVVGVWLMAVMPASGQKATGFSNSAGMPRVLLIWSADKAATGGYVVYRKEASEPSWPGRPATRRLRPITNCTDFKAIIPQSSNTWNAVAAALADSTGGIPPIQPLADVCSITSLGFGTDDWEIVQVLAGYRPDVARVIGQSWTDGTVSSGKKYTYRVIRVDENGTELPLLPDAEITITAGSSGTIPTPSNVQAVEGDAMVQVLWEPPASEKFQGFVLERRPALGGAWQRVSDVDQSAEIAITIALDTLVPPLHGFTDYQRYDESNGALIAHDVPNPPGPDISVNGPFNGTAYRYRVRHIDPIGNVGPASADVTATPHDSTRPGTPTGLVVTANESTERFDLQWNVVRLDVKGHAEEVVGYRVYRYEQPSDVATGGVAVGGLVPQPAADTAETISFTDPTPGLRDPCGDKTWYYRVEAEDDAGNRSFRSIAVGDALKDTTRPDPVKGTAADGFDDYIRVMWDLSSDCDIDEYRIYRAHCNYGDWIPCPDSTYDGDALEIYKRYVQIHGDRTWDPKSASHYDPDGTPKLPEDCGGPFVLIGTIPHTEAVDRKDAEGVPYFDDETIPAGSPICYAYVVKAVDRSQNESGTMPLPDPVNEIIVCQRLRDRTPPGPAIISGLLARDSTVIVEWIGPPIQDIAAWHVYRSDRSWGGTWTWVGGRTVVPPPGTGAILTEPYKPAPVVGCDSIPLVSRDYMSAGSYPDVVDDHESLWYKVIGVDKDGNETPVDSAVALSTFTFTSARRPAPTITSVTPIDEPCALTVKWDPAFDSDSLVGFALFRCRQVNGDYYQIGSVIKENEYQDNTVARSTPYYYRVAMLRKDGSLSQLSPPVQGTVPQ